MVHPTVNNPMEQTECLIPSFVELTKPQIELFNKNSYIIQHRKGETIFIQERPVTHLIYIKSGLIKLFKEIEENRNIIINIVPPRQFLGLGSVFSGDLYPYSASSIEGGELIYTATAAIRDLFEVNGKFGMRLMALLSAQKMFVIDRMIALTKKQVPGRIAEMLLDFAQNIYHTNAYMLPISRTEIADYVQTTKETVSRTLTEFKNDRIIELNDKNVVLKSLDLLGILNRIG
jgi:CRP/FNR family transcriptional regulator, polysaccharide utilization system transcription regulator